ncbi:MAG: 4'-phosphopantetheinyl transferase superfamily protein, partial [Chitinophagaceae bacterium]
MPLYFQENIDQNSRLGIWKITEAESFFLQTVTPVKKIKHAQKRLQHLATNYLLTQLFPEFPQAAIQTGHADKPFLPSSAYFFSLAHTNDFAAALVSTKNNVGIDIEPVSSKPFLLKDKFLKEEESNKIIQNSFLPGTLDTRMTMAWCAKEAVYKWWGKGGISLKNNMQISGST